MLTTGPALGTITSRGTLNRRSPSSRPHISTSFVIGIAFVVGLVSFLATELMHYLLIPDLGRHQERLVAEALSAFIVSCLTAKLANVARRQHRLAVTSLQTIAEMNHHIRNALTSISLSAQITDNKQLIRVIYEGVDRIDWTLREILPRVMPLREDYRHGSRFF
ncbi:MAG: hypothetical protein NVS1B11_36010 [Terriglobales bacterium]